MSETKPEAIYTRFDPETDTLIRQRATEKIWSLSTVVRELVKKGLEREREERT